MKIEKGKYYLCKKNYREYGSIHYLHFAGKIYLSETDGCITDEKGEKDAKWNNDTINEYFEEVNNGAQYLDITTKTTDPINPAHYKSYSVETIDMMVAIYGKEKVAIHCELTAFKYRMRAGKKDDLNTDLKKEEWYINKAKELRNEN